MTALVAQPLGIPAPRPSPLLAPYWEGCRAGELRYQRCTECGAVPPKAAPVCAACVGSSLEWVRSTGRGVLYSWTVVWRPQHPSFVVPYAPAIVTLDEGWRMITSMIGCDTDALADGLDVTVEFHPANDDIVLPYFRPA